MLPTADAHFAQIGRELAGDVMKRRQVCNTKHLHDVETRFYCPQKFLSLDLQCRDDVS